MMRTSPNGLSRHADRPSLEEMFNMKRMTSAAAAVLLVASLDAGAASLRFDNSAQKPSDSEWVYQLGDLTATVTSQGGPLFYNGVERAIGVGTSVFNGAIANNETVTVHFNQPVTLSQISFRQWENPGPLGTVYDRVVLSWDEGQSITLTDSGQGVDLLDDFVLPDIELTQFTLTPDHHNTDRKSTRLNSSHVAISYAVFCL